MFCKNCGKEIDETSKFCNFCGTATNKESNFQNIKIVFNKILVNLKKLKIFQKNFYIHNKKILFVILGIIVILLVLLSASYVAFPYILTKISISNYNHKNYDNAIIWCNRAMKINSNFANAYYNRANAKYEIQDYSGAREDYNKAIELKPKNDMYYFARGNHAQYCKDALEDFNTAIKLNSKNPQYYAKRAQTYSCLSDNSKAFEDINTAISLKSNDPEIYFSRAQIYETAQKYKEALSDYNKAIELAPNKAIYYSGRGGIKEKLWDNNGALRDFDTAIKLEPNEYYHYVQRGMFKSWRLKKEKEALKDFDKAIELNPVDSFLFRARCGLKLMIGDTKGAMKDANSAIELAKNDEDSASAYHYRGLIKYKMRNYSGAADDYLKAYNLNPSQEYFQDYMSSSYNSVMSTMPVYYSY